MEDQSGLLVVGWIIFALVVGFIGSDRTTGFLGAFLLSLLLSPLLGLIIVLTSQTKSQKAAQNSSRPIIISAPPATLPPPLAKPKGVATIHDELEKLQLMKEKKMISDSEYEELRKRILNQ